MSLVPCASCRRHLRDAETACPFCSAPRTASRLAVLAIFSSAVALAACYGGPPTQSPRVPDEPDAASAPPADPAPTNR